MGWGNRDLTGFGQLLRQAREYKGVSLRDAERKTRIPRRHLSALENEEFHELPPLIYARGIVRNYAQYLGLDPVEALSRFEQCHGQRSGGFRVVPAVKTTEVPSHWAPNFAIIAFMVVMSAVIFAWMYSAYFAPPENGTPTEQAIETPEADQDVAVIDEDDDADTTLREGGGEAFTTDDDDDAVEDVDDSDDLELAGDEGVDDQESGAEDDDAQSEPADGHTFLITTTERVWIEATVDGEVAFQEVVAPGTEVSLEGDHMSLVSGNAPYVLVSVDGAEPEPLGDHWDASNSYP